jgi:SHS2 domain-containing protein
MKKFEFLDITTADTAFVAYGKDLNKVFENAALAMFEVMINTKQIKPKIKKTVKVKNDDLKGLLFGWLNELLIFYGSDNLAFSKFEVKVDEKKIELKAVLYGEKIDVKKHEVRTEVKAATYHKMEIKKLNGNWEAKVIVDI